MASTLLYLVRHGEQARAPGDGQDPGLGLSALGEEQAGYLGHRLASVPFDIVRHVLGAPWWRWMGLNQFNCALTIIKVTDGEPAALVTFNDIGHLPVDRRGNPPVRLLS